MITLEKRSVRNPPEPSDGLTEGRSLRRTITGNHKEAPESRRSPSESTPFHTIIMGWLWSEDSRTGDVAEGACSGSGDVSKTTTNKSSEPPQRTSPKQDEHPHDGLVLHPALRFHHAASAPSSNLNAAAEERGGEAAAVLGAAHLDPVLTSSSILERPICPHVKRSVSFSLRVSRLFAVSFLSSPRLPVSASNFPSQLDEGQARAHLSESYRILHNLLQLINRPHFSYLRADQNSNVHGAAACLMQFRLLQPGGSAAPRQVTPDTFLHK